MRRRPCDSAEPPIRLMIVDDSAVARAVLARMVSAEPHFRVAALAANARDALGALETLDVDIVLLDLEMPGTHGLDALPDILRAGTGAQVLIVSSMAEAGAEMTVRALAAGAADTLPKPGTGYFAGRFAEVLAERIRRIGRATRERERETAAAGSPPLSLRDMPQAPLGCLALAASTGGLQPLTDFLQALPRNVGGPILVTQHLPPVFMPHFARQLERSCGRRVTVAEHGENLLAERVYVAPGDAHLCAAASADGAVARLDFGRAPSGCLPSADPMLASVADVYGERGLAVILSGMGRDGLQGSRRLIECGGAVIAQDRASAAIWGMPRAVAEAGLACAVLPPRQLAHRVGKRIGDYPWN
jgi:two-component system chemotaxis response regulator CheB